MFKYSAKKYSDLLAEKGSVRIGTLFDFRRIEHKRGIADKNEGIKTVSKYFGNVKYNAHDVRLLELRALGINSMGGAEISDCKFSREISSPDLYILCLSSSLDIATMKEFEDSDSCVEITQIKSFLQTVTSLLNRRTNVKFQGVHEVHYEEREVDWDGVTWGTHPALVKEPKFQNQCELRAVWKPHSRIKTISPIILQDDRLARYCAKRVL